MIRRRSTRRRAFAAIVLVLALLPWYFPAPGTTGASPSLAVRWLGPFARSAATVQWIRVDAAIRDGRSDLALARAETAMALDPGASRGWLLIASHLVYERASPERELDAARRLAWLRSGLDFARRAEATADDPAEFAEWQGFVIASKTASDPGLPWPGGARAMWLEAAACFERAAAHGSESGAELARHARVAADEVADGL